MDSDLKKRIEKYDKIIEEENMKYKNYLYFFIFFKIYFYLFLKLL